MTTIQAYRRTKEITQAAAGLSLVFRPNARGDVVCDVQDDDALEFLLGEASAFRVYAEQVSQVTLPEPVLSAVLTNSGSESTPEQGSAYVLKYGESVFDLRDLGDDALHEFAKANGIKVHHKVKGNAARDKIVAHLSAEA